ncbi:hypothetical protein D3C72_84910 [compost metagenome]
MRLSVLNMKKFAYLLAPAALCLAPVLSNAQALVPAGKMFSNAFLDVRAPLSGDWVIVKSSQAELAFARTGTAVNESYIAQVSLFALPDLKDKAQFEALVKQGVEADSPLERFKPISASYEYSEQRGYSCIKYVGVTEDMKAKTATSATETVTLKLQFNSLYCQHPTVPGVGFMVGMSHRGDTVVDELAQEAATFIEGVQVSKNTAKPVVQTETQVQTPAKPAESQAEVQSPPQQSQPPAEPEVETEVRG